jgi:hypothetical protein
VTASYFRGLASRCNAAAVNCFDLSAKEQLRGLAHEFEAKACELDGQQSVDNPNLGALRRGRHNRVRLFHKYLMRT